MPSNNARLQRKNQMFAHYVATKTIKYVIISTTNRPVGEKVEVKGKAEARKVAEQNKAQPWNF